MNGTANASDHSPSVGSDMPWRSDSRQTCRAVSTSRIARRTGFGRTENTYSPGAK